MNALRADGRYPVMILILRMVLALPLLGILVANLVAAVLHRRIVPWSAVAGEVTAALAFSGLVALAYATVLARSVNRAIPQDQRFGYLDGLRATASDLLPRR